MATFTVLVAADLGGKVNFEMVFAEPPSLEEFREEALKMLRHEHSLRIPAEQGELTVDRVQVFDEAMRVWVELVAAPQLRDWAQVYFFQRRNQWHKESPGRIPPPCRPSPCGGKAAAAAAATGAAAATSPARCSPPLSRVQPLPDPAAVPHAEKVRGAWAELDGRGERAVSLEDWTTALQRLRISGEDGALSAQRGELLFQDADADRDGVLSFGEWSAFAAAHPKLLDAVFWRGLVAAQDRARGERIEAARGVTAELQHRLQKAREAANAAEVEAIKEQEELAKARGGLEARRSEQAAAERVREGAQEAVEAARDRLRELDAARSVRQLEAEKAASALRAAQRATHQAEQSARIAEHAVKQARHELDELRERVARQEEELQRQEGHLDNARRVVAEAQNSAGRAQDASEAAEQDLLAAAADHTFQEREVRDFLEAERVRTESQRDASRALVMAQAVKASQEQGVAQSRDRQRVTKELEEQLKREVAEQQRTVAALERRELEIMQRRLQEEAREGAVIEQEVLLAEQRRVLAQRSATVERAASERSPPRPELGPGLIGHPAARHPPPPPPPFPRGGRADVRREPIPSPRLV